MALPTCLVVGTIYGQDAEPVPLATVDIRLDRVDRDGAIVIPLRSQSVQADENGEFTVALWPNVRGDSGSQYIFRARYPDGGTIGQWTGTVPDEATEQFHIVITTQPPPPLTDAEAAQIAAEAAAAQAFGHRQQTALDVAQTGDDRVATGQDATQTGEDRTATGEDRTAVSDDRAAVTTMKGEVEDARDATISAASSALTDIEAARVAALSEIDTDRTAAVDAVNAAASSGVTAVEAARNQGVGAVESARDAALSSISTLVTEATTARNEAVSAANQAELDRIDAQSHAQATNPFQDQNETEFDAGAKGYAQQAASSASDASDHRDQTVSDAAATAADRVQTGLDVVQTGEDRVATGQDRDATGDDRTAVAADKAAAESAKDDAETAAGLAEAAADVASTNAGFFESTSDGLAGTDPDDYFSVPAEDSDTYATLYQNDSDTDAIEITRFPSLARMRNLENEQTRERFFHNILAPIGIDIPPDVLVWASPYRDSGYEGEQTRPGTGWTYNSQGILIPKSADHSRPYFDPATGKFKGLLIEPARENLLLWSEDFSQGVWTKTRCTITANQEISPDGTLTADLMTATDADARIEQSSGLAAGTIAGGTFWVKSATGSDVAGQLDRGGLDITPFTATNQWQRIQINHTGGAASISARLRITNSGDALYIWGAQVEEAAFPTSYIPTTTAAVIRPADTYTIPQVGDRRRGFICWEGVLDFDPAVSTVGSNQLRSYPFERQENRQGVQVHSPERMVGRNVLSSEMVTIDPVPGGSLQGRLVRMAYWWDSDADIFGISVDGESAVNDSETVGVALDSGIRYGKSTVHLEGRSFTNWIYSSYNIPPIDRIEALTRFDGSLIVQGGTP